MKKVLVVDGSPVARRFVSYALRLGDYLTFEAEDAIDALEKLSMMEPDAVVVEVHLPSMDGLTFARSVRNNFYFLDVPMAMLTAASSDDTEHEAMDAGINLFLRKPITSHDLLAGIDSLFKERP
jgi:two-component system chemotaxis response regulator CheY